MRKVLLKSVILFALLLTGSFATYVIPQAEGISDFVTVTSTNVGGRDVLQVNNNASSISDIFSFLLEVKNGNFKSFKLENGWIGKKTSPTAVSFISSTPSPGYDIRVVGQSFSPSAALYLYIGGQKIDSFASDEKGNFVVTSKIPNTQQPGSTALILKDQQGNQKTFTTNIMPAPQTHV